MGRTGFGAEKQGGDRVSERGRLDSEALRAGIEDGSIETVLTVFPDLYGRLLGKRIVGRFYLDEIADGGMHACDYLLACDMEMDPTPGYAFTSWETGYGDMRAIPDATTLRRADWLDRTAIVICDSFEEEVDVPISVAPRNILKRQVARANALGLHPHCGSELEFFLFDETYPGARTKAYHDLQLSQGYNEDYHVLSGSFAEPVIGAIRRHADASAIQVEFSKGEASSGQHEINLRYAEAVEMADRHVIYKLAAKEIAAQQGRALTFMAKWHTDHAGNSLHVHLSLLGADGSSAFKGSGEPLPGTQVRMSDTFRHAVGGMLAHADALSLLFAPNVNSYKRYVEDTFAPTRIAWSYDNRTVGFRVVGHGDGLRIECRIPGGDANPYLVYAGLIAAALDGIEKQRDPGPLFEGNGYSAESLPRVAGSLGEAIATFDASALMHEAFGDDVVAHLVHFARAELRAYDRAVTDFERIRFFERG
jgi:glutamine synthetase